MTGLRFWAGLNPARSESEIYLNESLWPWKSQHRDTFKNQWHYHWYLKTRRISMIPEMILEMIPICCKKSFWINRNGSKGVFRLMDFREFTISHELLWEFLFNISEILDQHNQGHTRIFTWNFSYQLIVKANYRVVKVLHQCNGLCRNNSFVTWSIFYHIP